MIDRTPVSSGNIKSVGYDPDGKTLAIEFNGGSIYHYHDIEPDLHEQLISAKSVGGFVHANIKGVYKHSKQ